MEVFETESNVIHLLQDYTLECCHLLSRSLQIELNAKIPNLYLSGKITVPNVLSICILSYNLSVWVLNKRKVGLCLHMEVWHIGSLQKLSFLLLQMNLWSIVFFIEAIEAISDCYTVCIRQVHLQLPKKQRCPYLQQHSGTITDIQWKMQDAVINLIYFLKLDNVKKYYIVDDWMEDFNFGLVDRLANAESKQWFGYLFRHGCSLFEQ